jgi:hypothetical protein
MKPDSTRIDPLLTLARIQMELVSAIHLVHLAIVSGKDETRLIEFEGISAERMMNDELPDLIGEISALGVILSSPTRIAQRYGATVTLIDRTLESFYVPIVRITNAATLVGDFRATAVPDPEKFERIHARLSANWLSHDN